jgi:multidrug efflux pump
MHFSEWFIRRPVGTSLLAIAITLAGAICFFLLPVSPLPQVEYPTVSVSAGLPGASPETMASAVASLWVRQASAAARAISVSSGTT